MKNYACDLLVVYNTFMGDDVTFFDLFDPSQPRSDKSLADTRMDVCKSCEFFMKGSHRCSLCKCFMKLKTTLELATCPMGKW